MTNTFKSWLAAGLLCLPLGAASQTTTVVANDVAINGESFFGASNIRDELNRLARQAGVIGSTGSFRQIAVSGAVMTQILGYYVNATPKPKYVISDGGGNDLMSTCPAPATVDCPKIQATLATVRAYFDSMKTGGTEKVLWMRYPDPQGTQWATLKTNQDLYNPAVKAICDSVKKPKCVWIDLRPTWEGHYAQYTTDGIHPTNAGGTATAEAFWKVLVDSSFFAAKTTALRPGARGLTAPGGSRLEARDLDGRLRQFETRTRARVRTAPSR
jgi:lysophospholipase L1-like esterase